MKTPTPLKDLPGFATAADHILYHSRDSLKIAALDLVGNLVVPGIGRISTNAFGGAAVDYIAMGIAMLLGDERRRLRLVPHLPIAANDCEAP